MFMRSIGPLRIAEVLVRGCSGTARFSSPPSLGAGHTAGDGIIMNSLMMTVAAVVIVINTIILIVMIAVVVFF